MDHQLICSWLGLPAHCWPPDHYTLLGLPPGEADTAQIEQHAHERLARLRCYQLSNPGPATEAMNRLAQAFICLTDPHAKRAYDTERFPHLVAPAPAAAPTPAVRLIPGSAIVVLSPPTIRLPARVAPDGDTGVVHAAQTQIDWRTATPPPLRGLILPPPASAAPPPPPAPAGTPGPAPALANGSPPAPAPAPKSTPPVARAADPVFATARSPEARRGLRSRRGMLERVLLTRRLLRLWERAGKYLGRPRRRSLRTAEEGELARLLERTDELLLHFPPLLGQPGQPGYRVLALAHGADVAGTFRGLDEREREALARDWVAGLALLQAHRQFLRQDLRARRRRGPLGRLAHALRGLVNDHPVWISLVLLGVIAASLGLVLRS
jgi:hypothetical protein